MKLEEKYRLRINRANLVKTIDVKYVLNQLIAVYVFDIDDDERIRAAVTSQDRAAKMLNLLEKSTSDDAYQEFREALAEPYPHLVELLDKTDMSKLEQHCRRKPTQEKMAVQPVRRKEEGQLVRRAPPRGGTDCTDGGDGPRLSSTTSMSHTQNVAKIGGRGNFVIMGANQVNVNINRT